jgi:hypothetical protein
MLRPVTLHCVHDQLAEARQRLVRVACHQLFHASQAELLVFSIGCFRYAIADYQE